MIFSNLWQKLFNFLEHPFHNIWVPDSLTRAPSPSSSLSAINYSPAASDKDRLALDISALKKQYAKLRERQRQAHIILTGNRLHYE
jgi:hypothetical protein